MSASTDLTSLESLYREAALATAAGSKSFYFATRFFPRHLARSAHAVYWFCRTTDDLVDEAPNPQQGRRDLDEWEAAVRSGFAGSRPQHPVLRGYFDAVERHSIPAEYALDLIAGVRMDLDCARYGSFGELRVFCYRVASTVGLMMSKVIGFERPALETEGIGHAIDLGIAMQLTNILRDVGTDLALGRIYLPADEMARFGYSEEDLRTKKMTPQFEELLRFQIERARMLYAQAQPGIPMLHPDGRFAVKVASDVYREILAVIERNGYDVFHRRAVVPSGRKYWLSARTMAVPAIRHSIHSFLSRAAFWRA